MADVRSDDLQKKRNGYVDLFFWLLAILPAILIVGKLTFRFSKYAYWLYELKAITIGDYLKSIRPPVVYHIYHLIPYLLIFVTLMIIVWILDKRRLSLYGYNHRRWDIFGILCLPIYMVFRAIKTTRNWWPVIVQWALIIVFLIVPWA